MTAAGDEDFGSDKGGDRASRAGSASVPADRHVAQGDFQKLLLAGTADRSEIFRKMFHTEIYQELQNRLREEAKARWKTYDEKKRSISQYLDNVVCPEDARWKKSLTG